MGVCVAVGCRSRSSKDMRLFRFPVDQERRAVWVQLCRRVKWQPTEHSRLCEVHFEQSQFECKRADGRKLLKWNAIPTIFNVPNPSMVLKNKRKPPIKRNLPVKHKNEKPVRKETIKRNLPVKHKNEKPVRKETTSMVVYENDLTAQLQKERRKLKLQHCNGTKRNSSSTDSSIAGLQKLIDNAASSYNDEHETFGDRETFISEHSTTLDCEEIEDSKETLEDQYVVEKVKSNLCRVCGCPGGSLIPIFGEKTYTNLFHGLPLAKVLEMYLLLQVNKDDQFPLSICIKCRDTLREWHQFYVTCAAANVSFKILFEGEKDQEASSCAVNSSRVPENSGIISKSSRNDHTYVKDEPEETEIIELDVENEDNINAEGLEKSDEKQSCKDKLFFCKYCHHSINDTEKMEQDVDEYEDIISAPFLSRPYFCKFCRQSYCNTIEMKNHVLLCREEPTVCDICGKLLLHRKLLVTHRYQKHHFYMRVCDRCGKSVPSKHYSRHCDAFHSGSYCCKLCCNVLGSKALYREHMRKHGKGQIKARLKIDPVSTDDGVHIYQCPICKVLFKDLPAVIMHLNEPKTIQCPTCSIKFNNEKRLAIHTCKKWECQFCQKSFFSRVRFVEHKRIHTGEKPYKCHFCCASFRRLNQRIVHQKTHGPPSHVCKYCDKKFKHAISLRSHMNAHEGVFFSCAICEKKFPGENYLQRHMKTHESSL